MTKEKYRVKLDIDVMTPEWWVEVYRNGKWEALFLCVSEEYAKNWIKNKNGRNICY